MAPRSRPPENIWRNTTYADFLNTVNETVLKDQKEIAAQALKKNQPAAMNCAPGKPPRRLR
ncbi:MAG: hypothetical protein IPJ01_12885 [Micavibrio sp.]|nr:hypothetical protein [Micavibrio sp.]